MSNINYGNILSRAWKTTFKHKWLWVYGLAIASLAGAGSTGTGGGGGNGGSNGIEKIKEVPGTIPPDAGEKLTSVLGATTSIITEWVSHVPWEVWVILGIVSILIIVYGIVIQILMGSWAGASLIGGLKDAEEGQTVTLVTTTWYGKKYWKEIFLLSLISTSILLLVIFGFTLLIVIGVLLGAVLQLSIVTAIWVIVLVLIFIPVLIIAIPMLSMISVYGGRLIVLHNHTAKESFKKSLELAKSNFLQTALMGIIKGFITTSLGCISTIVFLFIVGIPALIVGVIEFTGGMHFPSLYSIIIWLSLFLAFLYATLLVRGILTVFSYSTWNLFFKEIMKDKKI